MPTVPTPQTNTPARDPNLQTHNHPPTHQRFHPPFPPPKTGELAFGKKGRPASPGKPRIPPMATVEYDLQLVGLPGKEVEIIDLLGAWRVGWLCL